MGVDVVRGSSGRVVGCVGVGFGVSLGVVTGVGHDANHVVGDDAGVARRKQRDRRSRSSP